MKVLRTDLRTDEGHSYNPAGDQLFSHVGTGLPCLNQYKATQGHNSDEWSRFCSDKHSDMDFKSIHQWRWQIPNLKLMICSSNLDPSKYDAHYKFIHGR